MGNILKKMSVKDMGCTAGDAADPKYAVGAMIDQLQADGTTVNKVPSPFAGKEVKLCIIYGKAAGIKVGEDRRSGNPWTALEGEFEGICIQEGKKQETYHSGLLFLPGGAQEVIEGAVRSLEAANTPGVVEFAVEISAYYDPDSITKYRYKVGSLVAPTAADSMSALRALVQPRVTTYLGPAKDATPAQIAAAPAASNPAPAASNPAPVTASNPAPATSRRR